MSWRPWFGNPDANVLLRELREGRLGVFFASMLVFGLLHQIYVKLG
jgi:hypothetical protein